MDLRSDLAPSAAKFMSATLAWPLLSVLVFECAFSAVVLKAFEVPEDLGDLTEGRDWVFELDPVLLPKSTPGIFSLHCAGPTFSAK